MTAAIYSVPVVPVSFLAGGAIPANSAVKMSAEDTVVVTTAITDLVIGFARTTAASGERVEVETNSGSIVKAICGDTITYGLELMPKGSATTGTVVASAGATAITCGIALQGGASGETIRILFRPGVKSPANT